jgi:hypothetical protein
MSDGRSEDKNTLMSEEDRFVLFTIIGEKTHC